MSEALTLEKTSEISSPAQTSPEKTLPPLPEAKEVSSLLPDGMGLDILRQARIVPLRIEDGVLIVGAVNFDAWPKAQMLGVALGYPIDIEIRDEKEIGDLLHTLYDLRSVAADEAAKNIEGIDDIDDLTREDVLSDSVDVPVIRLVNGLFVDALRQRATDIHVEPYEDEVLIRFRIDGVLQDRLRLPRSNQAPLTSRIKVMSRMDIAEHMAPQDGRIGITVGDRAVDVPVIRLVNGLFVDALRQRATDIHVEPYEDEVLIRFRIDGVLQDRLRLPRSNQAPLRKIHKPLRNPSSPRKPSSKHHNSRRPRRICIARSITNSGQRESRSNICFCVALNFAPRP